MDARGFRALADRCKELARGAARDDIRQQLRQWAEDFEGEAEAAERRPIETAERRPRAAAD